MWDESACLPNTFSIILDNGYEHLTSPLHLQLTVEQYDLVDVWIQLLAKVKFWYRITWHSKIGVWKWPTAGDGAESWDVGVEPVRGERRSGGVSLCSAGSDERLVPWLGLLQSKTSSLCRRGISSSHFPFNESSLFYFLSCLIDRNWFRIHWTLSKLTSESYCQLKRTW